MTGCQKSTLMVGGTFLSKPIQVQQPVQNVTAQMRNCLVMQNYGYLGQLSLALLFTSDKQFAKQVGTVGSCNVTLCGM